MATALDEKPSRIGPSTPARYARRAMRQALRRNDPAAAAKFAEYLEGRNELSTVRSAESRKAEDRLRDEQDAVIEREQTALSSNTPAMASKIDATASTPSSGTQPQRIPLGASGGRSGPEKPVPGGTVVPENKVLANSALQTPVSDSIVQSGFYDRAPLRPDPRSVEELRASSARNFAEAERLRNINIDPSPAARIPLRPSSVDTMPQPAPDLEMPAVPTLSPTAIQGPEPLVPESFKPRSPLNALGSGLRARGISAAGEGLGFLAEAQARGTLGPRLALRASELSGAGDTVATNARIAKLALTDLPVAALKGNAARAKRGLRNIRDFGQGLLGN